MSIVVTVLHVSVCIFLMLTVLLQAGKGGGMGATFGGGSSSGTVFGGSGAGNFLSRMTVAAAVIFMLTSMTLAYLSSATGVDSLKVYSSDQKKQAKEKRKTHEDILKNFGAGAEGEAAMDEAMSEGAVPPVEGEAAPTPEAEKAPLPEETTKNNTAPKETAPKAESKTPSKKTPAKKPAPKPAAEAKAKVEDKAKAAAPKLDVENIKAEGADKVEDIKTETKNAIEKVKEAAPTKDVIPSEVVPKELPKAPVEAPEATE